MEMNTRPLLREDLAIVELDGEAVIYDEATADLHHLNPTATSILWLCDGSATIAESISQMADAYGVSASDIAGEVRGVLEEFGRRGLLQEGPGSDDA